MKSSSTDITTKSRTYSLWHRLNVFSLVCVKIFKNNSTKTYNMQMIFVCLRSYTSSIDFSLAKCVCVCSKKKNARPWLLLDYDTRLPSSGRNGNHVTGTEWRPIGKCTYTSAHWFRWFLFFSRWKITKIIWRKKFKSFFGRNKWLAG